ncbi:phage antirepressor KilAC domain-containing protein [Streptantibioticus silvisoli]|uniref:Phage antirepressor KilAC domain-containing protein n=1 Tax=Streptantibioticus silvisoli TaxID=2705255 RepID=A0ABT6W4X4_9ACTN|nr:phage antirepressor KilAC domain-containing protein [Streptantibioticus silvisoli]MDI5965805.1 phage antirepressor KilAC domain-containing protein [Streptantibioticus silvisoli]
MTAEPTNALQVFNVSDTNIRFGVAADGRPYSVATDFAKTMGHRDASNALRLLEDDEKGTQIVSTPGGDQRLSVIYEDGMWELIFRSSLPGAKAIKKQVKEILRQIRETGSYSAEPPREMTKLEALQAAIESEQKRLAAEARVAELEPAARSWDVLASADGDFSVGDAAKILSRDPDIQLGQNRLFTMLADHKWVYQQISDGRPRVFQTAVTRGWLSELPKTHYHPRTGQLVVDAPQVRVTAKGLHELHRRLGGSGPVQIPGAPFQPELGGAA